jgi:signal transduction histidine kinase/ligand-binding sensor domain-containing protein/DNA-binding response OmpR family regulator
MRIYHFIICIFLCWNIGFGQHRNVQFEQISGEVSWKNNAINSILQDYKGFVWLATWSGLIKYDGYSAHLYNQEIGNKNGLKGNKITCLFEDSKKRLWIGTNYTGFYQYDRLNDRFIQYQRDPNDMNSLSDNNIWAISEDQEGYIWIGTEKGLNRFDPEQQQFIHYYHKNEEENSLSYDFIYSLAESPDGVFWIGAEIGLNRLVKGQNGQEDYFIRYDLAPEGVTEDDFLRHNFIYRIFPSKAEPHTLWVGTSIGLKKIQYDPKDLSKISYETFYHEDHGLSHRFVSNLLEDDHYLWISTYGGLNRLDLRTKQFDYFLHQPEDKYSISNNYIRSLAKDRSGILWIGTNKGVNTLDLNNKAFRQIPLENNASNSNSVVSCLKPSRSKSGLWLSSNGGGLSFIPIEQDEIKGRDIRHYSISSSQVNDLANFVSDILIDRSNWIWIATHGAGVLKINEADIPPFSTTLDQLEQFTKEDVLNDDYVMSLYETQDSSIWIGYWDKGIARFDAQTGDITHFSSTLDLKTNLQTFPVIKIHETIEQGESILWLGTRGAGLYKLKYDRDKNGMVLIKHFQYEDGIENSLSNNSINSIYQNQDDYLWIGTENGLNRIEISTNQIKHFTKKDGLDNDNILAILSDSLGQIWVSSQTRISTISQTGEDFQIKNFDSYHGLEDQSFHTSSTCINDKAELLFVGASGLNSLIPQNIQTDSVVPQVAIVDFMLFNQSVPIGPLEDGRTLLEKNIAETSNLSLSYQDNIISFEFVGLHFNEPNKIQYAYQLEGFDPDWVYKDASSRFANYTNLPYKEFTFKVKAANGDGIWSEPVQLKLKVRPPFWLTGWAYFIYFLCFIGLLLGVRRITKLRADFNHSLQLEKVEREKLEEVNQMKLRFFTNISHELRTPLTLIVSPLEQLIKDQIGNKQLHRTFTRMNYNANRLLTMINQLLDIRKSDAGLMKLKVAEGNLVKFASEVVLSFKSLAIQQQIDLQLKASSDSILVWYDRDQMEKVFYNLLSNAFKFTPENGKITIEIKENLKAQTVSIAISDTGRGIPEEQLPHLFNRFYQVEQIEGNIKGGTGIGLALCKSIIEAHHGKIAVTSTLREGSTFQIDMQLGETHFQKGEKIEGFRDSEYIGNYGTLPVPEQKTPLPVTTSDGKKPKILIVEDNTDIRSYLIENLQESYHIKEADNGQDGLDQALADSFDLIIADISMPKMDGIEMCRQIKSNIHTSHIPVVLLTARTSLIFKIDGLETGADDYITKPFNMRLLATRIRNLITSRQKMQEKFAKTFDLSPSGIVMNSLDEQLLSQIKRLVEKHMDDSNFSVEQLATKLHMSRMQLYRKIKALTGQSPNKVIRSIRLQRAAQLLATKQYNVSDVTYMVGYNDLKSFREQFKKEYGVSPSVYNG